MTGREAVLATPQLDPLPASGPVIPWEGDLYGATVNLASRLVNIARPGTVCVADEFAAQLRDVPSLKLRALPAVRLKGIGRTRVWVLRRQGDVGAATVRAAIGGGNNPTCGAPSAANAGGGRIAVSHREARGRLLAASAPPHYLIARAGTGRSLSATRSGPPGARGPVAPAAASRARRTGAERRADPLPPVAPPCS